MPPLSQQIKDLENEVGAQLFRRTPYCAELTEAGSTFLSVIKYLPETAAQGALVTKRTAAGESGILRVVLQSHRCLTARFPQR
ncbi:LysR family transcriptional regulator [Salmonella enterica]|uniref:LysR family transcriptional regulator n=1 Tax=Salmonella enterica TaxID=28901 RepID=UPI0037588048